MARCQGGSAAPPAPPPPPLPPSAAHHASPPSPLCRPPAPSPLYLQESLERRRSGGRQVPDVRRKCNWRCNHVDRYSWRWCGRQRAAGAPRRADRREDRLQTKVNVLSDEPRRRCPNLLHAFWRIKSVCEWMCRMLILSGVYILIRLARLSLWATQMLSQHDSDSSHERKMYQFDSESCFFWLNVYSVGAEWKACSSWSFKSTLNPRTAGGGHICAPHRFFADRRKMAARSAAKFGIAVHSSFAHLV